MDSASRAGSSTAGCIGGPTSTGPGWRDGRSRRRWSDDLVDIERALRQRSAQARDLAERVRAVARGVASVEDVRWHSSAARRLRQLAPERAAALDAAGGLLDELAGHLDSLATLVARTLGGGR